jgi:hypothetical protein
MGSLNREGGSRFIPVAFQFAKSVELAYFIETHASKRFYLFSVWKSASVFSRARLF